MKERVLVTGGAGFIGSHICEALLRHGYAVRVLDDLSTGKRENVPGECEFVQGSVLDRSAVETAMAGIRHVFHQAARVTIRGSVDRFYEDAETNLMGTLQVLQSAGKHKVKRFVYASSMAVYSDAEKPHPVPESFPVIPASPYGVAKLAAERYALLTGPGLGLEPVVLRYFNTFGTRQGFTPYVGVITIFVTRLLRGDGITIFGDGEQRRDFVHVSDIVQANLRALTVRDAVGRTFNIGTGRGTSVNELAALLLSRLAPGAPVRYEPPREEELRNSVADITLARSILNYQPGTVLRKQIEEVIEYVSALNQ